MKRSRVAIRPLSDLFWLFVGPGVWFAQLAFVYGAEALICREPSAGNARIMVWAVCCASIAALSALIAFAIAQARSWSANARANDSGRERFSRAASLLLVLLSVIGVIWTTLPIAFVRACAAAPATTVGAAHLAIDYDLLMTSTTTRVAGFTSSTLSLPLTA